MNTKDLLENTKLRKSVKRELQVLAHGKFKMKMPENRIKERNQLLYVAYSRTNRHLTVYYRD